MLTWKAFKYLVLHSHSLRRYVAGGPPLTMDSPYEHWEHVFAALRKAYGHEGSAGRALISAAVWILSEGGAAPAELRIRGMKKFNPMMMSCLDSGNTAALLGAVAHLCGHPEHAFVHTKQVEEAMRLNEEKVRAYFGHFQ